MTTLRPHSFPESTGRMANGTWTAEEHDRFLQGMARFPMGPWSAIANVVGTRSVRQVNSHAQKYAAKVERHQLGKTKVRRNHASSESTTLSGHRVVPKIVGRLVTRPTSKPKRKQKNKNKTIKRELPTAAAVVSHDLLCDSSPGEGWSDESSCSSSRRVSPWSSSSDDGSSCPSSPASVGGFQSSLWSRPTSPFSLRPQDSYSNSDDDDNFTSLPTLEDSLDFFIHHFKEFACPQPNRARHRDMAVQ